MSKADSNGKNHSNKKQSKDRILRARDIIPGVPKSNLEKTAEEHTNTKQASNIPKFDLADDIMAKHREITAMRRKAPGKKAEAPSIEKTTKPLSLQQKIIADIVARDIEKLCRYDISGTKQQDSKPTNKNTK